MPRKQRIWVPGDTYHIMCRGNHQHNIFRDDEDREFYLIILESRDCFHLFCMLTA